jgi:alpha-galactosidase/6-phospho-beta-glucosidase family protein
MCRLYLKRPESQIVPFEKISLAKIRRELIQQNQLVESLQFQIQNAPDRIASYMRTIENIMRAANHAHMRLDREVRRQSILQEQVTRRARPRRVVVQVTEEIILV